MENNNNLLNNQPSAQPVQPVQPQAQPIQPQVQPELQQQYQQQYQQTYQQPYQQVQPQYMGQQYQANQKLSEIDLMTPEEKAARRKNASILCIISLGFHFIPETISGFLTSILENVTKASSISDSSEIAAILISLLFGGSYIASWVLMIIARIKYKESKFAKILMWVYIGILVAGIIAVALIIAMCAYMLKDCQGF